MASRKRFWLVTVSMAAHLGVGIGLYASGVWRIERLDAGRGPFSGVGVLMPPPPPPAGGSPPANAQKFEHHLKKKLAPVVQPTEHAEKVDLHSLFTSTETDGRGLGNGHGPG